jgi:hypothetical protein
MIQTKKLAGGLVATAAAALFLSGCATSHDSTYSNATADAGVAGVKCVGVNSCKGSSSCKTVNISCKGHNSCKGKGFVMLDKGACDQVGGKVG